MRGVSLEEIAGATRIGTRFLDALEKEAWDRLPGGVFNRGFVRAVARFLGLEEESLLAEYALATRPPVANAVPLVPPPPSTPGRAPWIALGLASLLALAGASAYGWVWFSARRAERNAAASAPPSAPVPPGLPPIASALPAEPVPPPEPLPQAPPPTSSPWTALPPEALVAPLPNLTDELRLTIGADKETYLTVTTDGHQVFAGAFRAGASRSFSAKSAVTVETQDAGAIRLELNGQALAPIGPSGQPGKLTLGRPNLRSEPGGHD